MPDASPRVFVSHAGEDNTFVLEFGTQLRSSGLDAWVSEWELLPGDSLVDGILQRGIEQSNSFVIVLSRTSITKPWVRKELAVAIERSVVENYKIIPVLLEGLARDDVPTGLRDILWVTHRTLPETVSEVVRGITGQTSRPALGGTPSYLAASTAAVRLADDPGDDLVLRSLLQDYAGRVKPTSGVMYFTDGLAAGLEAAAGYPVVGFDESMYELNRRGVVRAEQMAGHAPGRWLIREIPDSTWWAYGLSEAHDMEGIARRFLTTLANEQATTTQRLDSFEGLPFWLVKTVCWWLGRQGFIRYVLTNTGIVLQSVEPSARRWLRTQV